VVPAKARGTKAAFGGAIASNADIERADADLGNSGGCGEAVVGHGSPGASDNEGHPSASSGATSRSHDGGRGSSMRVGRGGEDIAVEEPSPEIAAVVGQCASREASDQGDEPEDASCEDDPADHAVETRDAASADPVVTTRAAPDPASAPEVAPSAGEVGGGSRIGGWERAFRQDDDLLRSCGFWCKRVEADGACLFRAFSDQLDGDGGAGHLELRERCVAFLEAHRAEFAPFVEGSFETYCSRLREPTAWGGHVEAQALSRALGVNTLIHVPAEAQQAGDVPGTGVEVLNFAEDAPCVQIAFHPRYHSGAHYNSVRCLDDSGDGVPAPTNLLELRRRMEDALRARS